MTNHITPNFSFADMRPARGLGSRVWDENNQELIDFGGGIAVNALGHCHPDMVRALDEQARKLWHVSNLYTTEPTQRLAKKLTDATFADRVFFCNSGAEANEAAFKLARKYGRDRLPEKHVIVSCLSSFHGRTLFTVSVGGQSKYSADFAPLPEGIRHIPFNDCAALEAAVDSNVCAVVIEPIQGESGVLPATDEFLQTARQVCDRNGALLIFDEVQTGMGRTGSLFAYMQSGVVPDVLTTAKSLGGGFPIGAMLTTETIAQTFSPGTHGTTYGGNPLACAVASKAFDLITSEEIRTNAKRQSEALFSALRGEEFSRIFAQIRGRGMLIGCVLHNTLAGQAAALWSLALKHGLMTTIAGGNVLRLAPALTITDEERIEGLARLARAVAAFQAA